MKDPIKDSLDKIRLIESQEIDEYSMNQLGTDASAAARGFGHGLSFGFDDNIRAGLDKLSGREKDYKTALQKQMANTADLKTKASSAEFKNPFHDTWIGNKLGAEKTFKVSPYDAGEFAGFAAVPIPGSIGAKAIGNAATKGIGKVASKGVANTVGKGVGAVGGVGLGLGANVGTSIGADMAKNAVDKSVTGIPQSYIDFLSKAPPDELRQIQVAYGAPETGKMDAATIKALGRSEALKGLLKEVYKNRLIKRYLKEGSIGEYFARMAPDTIERLLSSAVGKSGAVWRKELALNLRYMKLVPEIEKLSQESFRKSIGDLTDKELDYLVRGKLASEAKPFLPPGPRPRPPETGPRPPETGPRPPETGPRPPETGPRPPETGPRPPETTTTSPTSGGPGTTVNVNVGGGVGEVTIRQLMDTIADLRAALGRDLPRAAAADLRAAEATIRETRDIAPLRTWWDRWGGVVKYSTTAMAVIGGTWLAAVLLKNNSSNDEGGSTTPQIGPEGGGGGGGGVIGNDATSQIDPKDLEELHALMREIATYDDPESESLYAEYQELIANNPRLKPSSGPTTGQTGPDTGSPLSTAGQAGRLARRASDAVSGGFRDFAHELFKENAKVARNSGNK